MSSSPLREDRLALWDRLVRGEPVALEDCGELVTQVSHDASPEERAGSILLLGSIRIAAEANRATRRNLRAALRYWFSHTGTKDRPPKLLPRSLSDAGLEQLVGLYLSWPEAMESVGGNPKDYTALKRLESALRARCADEWRERFGSTPPDELLERR